jgi:hypothetical protein
MMAEEKRGKGRSDGERSSSSRQSNGKNQSDGQRKGQPHPPFTPEEGRKEGRKGGKASHDDDR